MRQPNQKGLYNKATIQYDEAEIATAASKCDNHIVYKCEKELPRDILNPENKVLEEPLSGENVLKRKVEIPDSVKNFYKALCTGEDEAKKTISSRKFRFVKSSASDALYSCSSG